MSRVETRLRNATEKYIKSFPLLYYFSIAALVSILLAAIGLGLVYRWYAVNQLEAQAERESLAFAKVLSLNLHEEVKGLLHPSAGGTPKEVIQGRIGEIVRVQAGYFNAAKVKIYAPSGETVFSTVRSDIGVNQADNPGVTGALEGKVLSSRVHREQFNAFDSIIENRDLLQTYLPIEDAISNTVLGVFELYSDMTPFLERIRTTERVVIAMVGGVLFLLFVVLFLFVYRADRIIRSQDTALKDQMVEINQVNRELELRVRERTQDLELLNQQLRNEVRNREKANEVLRETTEKFRWIMDHSLTVDILKDLNGRYLLVNRRFEELHGLSADQVVGKTAFDIMPREVAEKIVAQEEEVIRLGKPVESELSLPYIDGAHRMINIKFPIFSNRGAVIGIGTTATDITNRNKADAQFQQVQKMQAISSLAGGIAHTFNNLLQVIMSHTSQLMEETSPGQSHYKILTTINSQVEKGAELTGQLLGFAREGKYRAVPTNLNLILVGVTSLVGNSYGNIEVRQEIDDGLWDTKADEGQIEQALMNIIINACQAMPDGGVLNTQTRNVHLDESTTQIHDVPPGKYVHIVVRDNGVGIEPDVIPNIFEPFFTTKSLNEGHGLGLASAYGIIRNHDGFLTVESEVGSGTTFNIYLPGYDKVDGDAVES